MNAFNISFQAPVSQAQVGKELKPKNDVQQPNEPSVFSKLFQSTSSELQQVSGEQQPVLQQVNGEQQLAEMLKKFEEALNALQELPKDSLSPEELGTLAGMLQMLAQQTADLVKEQQGNPSQPLMSALQQIRKQLDELSALSTISFEEPVLFEGVEEKKLFSNSEQEEKSFDSLFSQLGLGEQETTGKQFGSFEKAEPFDKLIQQLKSLIAEVAQVTEQEHAQEQPKGNTLKIDSSFLLPRGQGANGMESNQTPLNLGNTGLNTEQALDQKNTSQVIPVGAIQDVQGVQKTDTSPQASTVRFTHLIEDLSEVFRGSLRLNSTVEGTQLRVNIFPEHLGHLDIRLTSLDGKITAQIFTASLSTKEALDLQVQQLRNSLMQQGISVEKIEIEHHNSQQSFGQQHANPDQRFSQQQQKHGISGRNGNAYRMEEEVAADRQPLSEGSVQVNYTI
jgi:flagellar hook-length control protein FliK